jgi:hypothetical protein
MQAEELHQENRRSQLDKTECLDDFPCPVPIGTCCSPLIPNFDLDFPLDMHLNRKSLLGLTVGCGVGDAGCRGKLDAGLRKVVSSRLIDFGIWSAATGTERPDLMADGQCDNF